jgi:hypothetical protein
MTKITRYILDTKNENIFEYNLSDPWVFAKCVA